jgi:hypothetical protein
MDVEQKRWVLEHGTPQEREFVAKYGDRKVSAASLLTSVLFFLGLAAGFFLLVGGYLYLSRSSFLRPVTGKWVGMLAPGTGAAPKRAVYLETSVSALHIFRPTLTGTVRMCSSTGDLPFQLTGTRTVSSDTLGVDLRSTTTDESGEIFGALRGNGLSAQYDGVPSGLQGELQRGAMEDFRDLCQRLHH